MSSDRGVTLDQVVCWRVWIGSYTDAVVIIAPLDASLDDIGRAAKVAHHDRMQQNVRPEHEEYDREFWTTVVAAVDVTKVERGDDAYVAPRLVIP